MIERFTVRSFDKMEHHPTEIMHLADEEYFNTMDRCEQWCIEQTDIKDLNFQIHHSVGAKNYRHGVGSEMGTVTWTTREYEQKDIPLVACWWDIFDVPSELDGVCQETKF